MTLTTQVSDENALSLAEQAAVLKARRMLAGGGVSIELFRRPQRVRVLSTGYDKAIDREEERLCLLGESWLRQLKFILDAAGSQSGRFTIGELNQILPQLEFFHTALSDPVRISAMRSRLTHVRQDIDLEGQDVDCLIIDRLRLGADQILLAMVGLAKLTKSGEDLEVMVNDLEARQIDISAWDDEAYDRFVEQMRVETGVGLLFRIH
jgi:hypothetical protein